LIKANEATKLLGRILREAREQKKKLLKEGNIFSLIKFLLATERALKSTIKEEDDDDLYATEPDEYNAKCVIMPNWQIRIFWDLIQAM
jgi:hypothetical protein